MLPIFTIFSVTTEGNPGNGTKNVNGNQMYNSSIMHDDTPSNDSIPYGNKNASNETYYPSYYESTTETLDEQDLIFLNGNKQF